MTKKEWGELLRKARKAAGYANPDDFAAALGTSRRQVMRWETGENRPRPGWQVRLAAHHPELGKAVDLMPPVRSTRLDADEVRELLGEIRTRLDVAEASLREIASHLSRARDG